MSYFDFNKRVFNFYIQRTKSKFCSFALDRTEFTNLVEIQQIKHFEILKSNWSPLLEIQAGIPLYFGLIAVQCFAATLMEERDDVTDHAYQIRLQELLGLNSNTQQLFKYPVGPDTIQEKIWHDAKHFLQETYGLKLEIPERKLYKGKYVQYPLSQLLLKTEDLKDFTRFYAEYFNPGENIPLYYFNQKLFEWLPRSVSDRAKRLLPDSQYKEQCCEQLFNDFQSWEGNIFQTKASNGNRSTSKYQDSVSNAKDLILIIQNESPEFYFQKTLISSQEILTISSCQYYYRGIILFNQVEDYENEYEQSRFLNGEQTVYLLVDKITNSNVYDFLHLNSISRITIAPNQALFQIESNKLVNSLLLQKYVYRINPISISGGIKLGKDNTFLTGFGPFISYHQDFKVLFENKPIEYNPETARAGNYKVRVNEYRDVSFNLIDVTLENPIEPLGQGWNLSSLNLSIPPSIEGCLIYPFHPEPKNPIRSWINANLGGHNNTKDKLQNFILSTIEYANRKKRQC